MLTSVLVQVEKQKTQLLEFISRMISFATPNPPAKNTHSLQKWLGEWLEGFGIQTVFHDLYPGEPLLVGRITGEKPLHTLILNGHVDVAQINEDEHWDSDPFVAQWDERYLYGRGAADMKGGFAAALWAVKLLRETGLPFQNNLMIQSVIGEEAGEHGTK
ncbi:MAG: M20/M25/M40 family metallo-hydrolase, partial [Coprothermobacterota bacterium]|nr:M20/M25/M40 family metallo-hydrolase [Coprothermobacterota bacterium]